MTSNRRQTVSLGIWRYVLESLRDSLGPSGMTAVLRANKLLHDIAKSVFWADLTLRPVQIVKLAQYLGTNPSFTGNIAKGLAATKRLRFTGTISTKHARDSLMRVYLFSRRLERLEVESFGADTSFLGITASLHAKHLHHLIVRVSFNHCTSLTFLQDLSQLRSLHLIFEADCGVGDETAWSGIDWTRGSLPALTSISCEFSHGTNVRQQSHILYCICRGRFTCLQSATFIIHEYIESYAVAHRMIAFINGHADLQSIHLELPAVILTHVLAAINVPEVHVIHHNGTEWLGACVSDEASILSIGEFDGPEDDDGHCLAVETLLYAFFGRIVLQYVTGHISKMRIIQLLDFAWPKHLLDMDAFATTVGFAARGFADMGIHVVDKNSCDFRGNRVVVRR